MTLQTDYGKRTLNETVLLFQHNQINLSPGFQRQSVWSDMDRRRLIQSIISEYPLPSIFLYRRSSRGKTVYDVIDGKQRLETILMFLGIGRFNTTAQLPGRGHRAVLTFLRHHCGAGGTG